MIANSPAKLMALILWTATSWGWAQAPKFEPVLLQKGSIKLDKFQLPGDARRGGGSPTTKELGEDWYAIEVKFDTTAPLTGEITLKFFTDMVDTLKKGDAKEDPVVILTAETTYINVPAGRGHLAMVYLHPTSILRYGGIRGAEGIKKANVRVEAYEGGEKVDEIDMKQEKTDWVKAMQDEGAALVPGVLLSPDQVAFQAFEITKFNQIKRATR